MVPLANGEAAHCGEADLALNVRQSEQSLQVTGNPATVGAIAAGERLLLLTDGHRVTCSGAVVKIDGTAVATIAGTIVNVHAVGDLLVVVGEHGMTYIARREGAWVVLDVADAIPQLSFTATAVTSSAEIAAYAFAEPYSTWRAPLASADCQVLATALRTAWNALTADAAAEGLHSAPMLVRWGVRLVDDSYLWLSEPQRVGDITLGNADRVSAVVTISSSRFTGIEASTMTLTHYRLGVDITRPIDASWLPLVKSIDVLATDEGHLLTSSRSLDYRCITRTTGGREYILEMGLSRRSARHRARLAAAVKQLLRASRRAVVADQCPVWRCGGLVAHRWRSVLDHCRRPSVLLHCRWRRYRDTARQCACRGPSPQCDRHGAAGHGGGDQAVVFGWLRPLSGVCVHR